MPKHHADNEYDIVESLYKGRSTLHSSPEVGVGSQGGGGDNSENTGMQQTDKSVVWILHKTW